MIRILHVFIIMNRGGAESMIMNYYRNINRDEIQFDFLVHRHEKGVFDDEIKDLGGKIHSLNPIDIINPKKYYNELRQFFKKYNHYPIVHSHINTFSSYPLKIAQEFNIKTRIAHSHTALPKIKFSDFLKKSNIIENIKTLIKFQLKKRIHKHTTHCFSCGEKAGKWLFGNHAAFKIINNAVDVSNFNYDESIANKYKEDNNLVGKLVIGHVGNFTEPKNHSYILDVFNETQKLNSQVHLVLIGDGPFKASIIEKATSLNITQKTTFLGVRTDIPDLCKMLDIFIFPSFYEGFPVTLIEAQAADLKILASDTITKKSKITNRITFMSIKDSPKNWAKKIIESIPYERKNNENLIKKNGYDIKYNALELQKFYLSAGSNH